MSDVVIFMPTTLAERLGDANALRLPSRGGLRDPALRGADL